MITSLVCMMFCMATHVRKNITLPRSLDERIRKTARKRGTTQSGLIVHLVETGLEDARENEHRYRETQGELAHANRMATMGNRS